MNSLRGTLLGVLRKYPLVRLCLVFGSAASGKPVRLSDLDIAVAAHEPLTPEMRLELQESFSEATSRPVDLVDLTADTGPIQKQALTKGVVVLNEDKPLYACLISRMWFTEADMMPYYRRVLRERRERFLHG